MTEVYAILKDAGLLTSYWGRKITAAEKRGEFTKDNCRKAASWTTCAVGKADSRISRYRGEGQPLNIHLALDGLAFYKCVKDNSFLSAAETLVKIEKRVAIVMERKNYYD